MELIKVNSLKLKIILSPLDIKNLGLDTSQGDCEESLSMRAFREILDKAKEQTGFESGTAQLYVQFYPSKDGGGEMYITRRGFQLPEGKIRHFGDSGTIDIFSTYITVFKSSENLIAICKRLCSDGFTGTSILYTCIGKYFLVLNGTSTENFNTYLSEYGKAYVSDSLMLAFLEEHGNKLCENNTVETFCEIFGRTI